MVRHMPLWDFRANARREIGMALDGGMLALAAVAGQTVVAAAVTDTWESAKRGFARLLGRGDPERTGRAEQRLEQLHQQLMAVPAADRELAQAQLAPMWQTRLFDLLEENPELMPDLRVLVDQVQARLPAGGGSGGGVARLPGA
jgi:hypothetical protein